MAAEKIISFSKTDANFSSDRRYRYELTRVWDENKPLVGFIGLNPSTADESTNDPTIWKLVRLSDSWGYGGLVIVNLFGYITPGPAEMKKAEDPVGPENDRFIARLATSSEVDKVVAVWGDDGSFMNRGDDVRKLICGKLWALKISDSGHPRHPRFLKEDVLPFLWK